MKKIKLIVLLLSINFVSGQYIKEKIAKIYYSDSDTITYNYSNYADIFDKLDLSKNDTISPGTNVAKGIILKAFIGKDTLIINGDNYPFARKSYVTIQTPKKTTVVAFRFNSSTCNFSQEYINENQGGISYDIPEVYELANIIWALSPSGKEATNLQKDTKYFKEVEKYFKPYLNHPIFQKLIFENKDYTQKYFEFRENSFIYEFDDNKIIKGANYNFVFGEDWEGFSNLFTELLPLVQDFSDQSNFRKFFKNHKKYYQNDLKRVTELLPIKNMWNWLEKEFPIKRNAYKIIFSPLIGGSHSTQNYLCKDIKNNTHFNESVMFICNANKFDSKKELTAKQKEGLMSGIVFTEIDHNYVNPISSKYKREISEIFKSKIWSDEKNGWYKNPQSVFNEYMTHSVFCIWVIENYDKETSDYVINERIKMNAERRGFIKFKEFNDEMMKLKKENPSKTATELYPQIIEWSKQQK